MIQFAFNFERFFSWQLELLPAERLLTINNKFDCCDSQSGAFDNEDLDDGRMALLVLNLSSWMLKPFVGKSSSWLSRCMWQSNLVMTITWSDDQMLLVKVNTFLTTCCGCYKLLRQLLLKILLFFWPQKKHPKLATKLDLWIDHLFFWLPALIH